MLLMYLLQSCLGNLQTGYAHLSQVLTEPSLVLLTAYMCVCATQLEPCCITQGSVTSQLLLYGLGVSQQSCT